MFHRLIFLVLLCTLSGCGPALDSAESSLLYHIAQDIESIKDQYPQLKDFRADAADTRKNFFSYIQKENDEVLIMNSGVYWFKVSLTEKAVDTFDSPAPVLSIEMAPMKKHLHLRVRGKDMALTQTLAAIVLDHGTTAGGIQRILELGNSLETMPRSRRRGMR
jgi:hypothetical protein